MKVDDDKLKELTLLLLYLNSWAEKELGYEYRRAWKGYDFGTLNELADDGMITGSNRSKSVYFTEEGEKMAKELMEKYLSEGPND